MDIKTTGKKNKAMYFLNTQCLSKIYKVFIVLSKISNLNLILKNLATWIYQEPRDETRRLAQLGMKLL